MFKLANRHSRGLQRHRTEWLVSWNCGRVLQSWSDTIGARGGVFDSVITRIRNGWCKFWDLVPLLTSRAFPLQAKDRLHSACVCSVMLYGSKTWPFPKDVIRLARNDARMVR